MGDKRTPFEPTTAANVVEAAKAYGVPLDGTAKDDPALCSKYDGCRSAATVGSVKVIVFKSATAAQNYRDTSDGAAVEKIGGRRYWSLVDYRDLGPEDRSAWRDLQREIIP
jgi:hypothetical protein